jgi:hypothetical protein
MKLRKVTVTGADDSISPIELFSINREYPFVEFGILLSKGVGDLGGSRFPSTEWLKELKKLYDENAKSKIHFSGHICGSWVKDIFLKGIWPIDRRATADFESIATRWQLNTHGIKHDFKGVMLKPVIQYRHILGNEIIFQYDNENNQALFSCGDLTVSALFDLSHGAGVLPKKWPKPFAGIPCGYAGGLSPDNIEEQLAILEPIVEDKTIWIDAESYLRSYDSSKGDYFDPNKVAKFLEKAKPWVKYEI